MIKILPSNKIPSRTEYSIHKILNCGQKRGENGMKESGSKM